MYNFDLADDSQLFRHFVKTLVLKRCENNPYTTNQFANLIFGVGNSNNMALVSRITNAYRGYFEKIGAYKKRLLVQKVKQDHPEIFGGSSSTRIKPSENKSEYIINDLIKALQQEIVAIKQSNRPIKIDGLVNIKKIVDRYVYSANVNWSSDDELILNEGALLKLMPIGIQGAVLSYDSLHGLIYFECSVKLRTEMYYMMEVDTTTIINPIIDVLETYNRDGLGGLAKIVTDKSNYPNALSVPFQVLRTHLDDSQKAAAEKALSSDVSFIWGPPGTGKSHCLSEILKQLLRTKERTLIVSVANVAVDQLLAKTLNSIDADSPLASTQLIHAGEILRIGYITEEPLVKRFDDAPSSQHILSLYRQIKEIQQRIHSAKTTEAKAQLTAEKRALSREVDDIQKKRIEKGNLLFTTATKAVLDSKISSTDFDNLVIDEASMMSIPYLFGLLKRVSKRVVIAGDFAQLSPICLSQTDLADKYLKQDLFSLAGIKKNQETHRSLSSLIINRRATEEICSLYNSAFYQGRMKVDRKLASVSDPGVFYVPLAKEGAEFTESKSRKNAHSFNVVTNFVLKQLGAVNSTIGVISPYRAQVNDYKKFFKDQKLPKDVLARLKIGTIHTFQGSEADTIIFDTVDTSDIGVGRLFYHEQGERLINVAVSRARDKLIVFGDLDVFYKSNQMSGKVLKVLNSVKNRRLNT